MQHDLLVIELYDLPVTETNVGAVCTVIGKQEFPEVVFNEGMLA